MSEALAVPRPSRQYRAAHLFAHAAATAYAAAIGAQEAAPPWHAGAYRDAVEAAERLHSRATARFKAIEAEQVAELEN